MARDHDGSLIAMCDTDEKIDDDNGSIVVECKSGNVVAMNPKNNKRRKLSTFVIGCDAKAKKDAYVKLNNDCLQNIKDDGINVKIMIFFKNGHQFITLFIIK